MSVIRPRQADGCQRASKIATPGCRRSDGYLPSGRPRWPWRCDAWRAVGVVRPGIAWLDRALRQPSCSHSFNPRCHELNVDVFAVNDFSRATRLQTWTLRLQGWGRVALHV